MPSRLLHRLGRHCPIAGRTFARRCRTETSGSRSRTSGSAGRNMRWHPLRSCRRRSRCRRYPCHRGRPYRPRSRRHCSRHHRSRKRRSRCHTQRRNIHRRNFRRNNSNTPGRLRPLLPLPQRHPSPSRADSRRHIRACNRPDGHPSPPYFRRSDRPLRSAAKHERDRRIRHGRSPRPHALHRPRRARRRPAWHLPCQSQVQAQMWMPAEQHSFS